MSARQLTEIIGLVAAARRLGVSEQTARRMADRGELRCFRRADSRGDRLFFIADVDRAAEERRGQKGSRG